MQGAPPSKGNPAGRAKYTLQIDLIEPTERLAAVIGPGGEILSLTNGGAADRAGFKRGDCIVAIDGRDSTTQDGLLSAIEMFQLKKKRKMPLVCELPDNHTMNVPVSQLGGGGGEGASNLHRAPNGGTPALNDEGDIVIRQFKIDVKLESPSESLGGAMGPGGRVLSVVSGGALDRAGFTPGTTIVEIDGNDTTSQPTLQKAIAEFRKKNSSVMPLTIEVAAMLLRKQVRFEQPDQPLGLHYERKTDGLMYVAGLQPGSPVERAGIEVGMAFYAINNVRIKTSEDLQRALSSVRRGQTSVLLCEMWEFDNHVPNSHQAPPITEPSSPQGNRTPPLAPQEGPSPFSWVERGGPNGETYVPTHSASGRYNNAPYNPDDLTTPAPDEIPANVIASRRDAPVLLQPSKYIEYPPPPFPEGGGVGGPVRFGVRAGRKQAGPRGLSPRGGRGFFDENPAASFRKIRPAPEGRGLSSPALQVRRDTRQNYFDSYQAPNFVHVPGDVTNRAASERSFRAHSPPPRVVPRASLSPQSQDRYGGHSAGLTVLI